MKLLRYFFILLSISTAAQSQVTIITDTVSGTISSLDIYRKYGNELPDSVYLRVGARSFVRAKLSDIINSSAGGTSWGSINGTLSNQTDLDNALNGKEPAISTGSSNQLWGWDKAWKSITGAYITFASTSKLLARNTAGGGPGEEISISQALDWLGAVRGSVIYRGASGWVMYGPGTAGQVFTTNGAGADPTWTTVSGGGGSPGGTGNELQYRSNATTFGAVSAVKSDGTNILRTSDNSPIVYDYDVRGGASNLNSRIGVISNFASPNAGGVVSGQYYDNSFQGTASSTLAGVANQLDLAPYYTSVNLSIDQIGVAVSTGVASTNVHIVIYDSDGNGWPNNKLYESGDLSTAAAGYAFASLSFTFSSGTQYWLGVLHSSTATLRTINVSSAVNLGLTSSTASNYATILRRTVTFGANACPSVWNFVNADRVANVTPPSIRFRAL